ncbi:hypothetical protein KCU62_g304, partial [Aureobasidium sp. EXF-3399]
MAPKFTSINAGASTCGAAAARARVQSQGPAVTGPIQRAVKTQRKPAKGANPEIMRKHIEDLKLELEREGENFRWPLGLTAGNVVVAKIKKPADVPDALSSLQHGRQHGRAMDRLLTNTLDKLWNGALHRLLKNTLHKKLLHKKLLYKRLLNRLLRKSLHRMQYQLPLSLPLWDNSTDRSSSILQHRQVWRRNLPQPKDSFLAIVCMAAPVRLYILTSSLLLTLAGKHHTCPLSWSWKRFKDIRTCECIVASSYRNAQQYFGGVSQSVLRSASRSVKFACSRRNSPSDRECRTTSESMERSIAILTLPALSALQRSVFNAFRYSSGNSSQHNRSSYFGEDDQLRKKMTSNDGAKLISQNNVTPSTVAPNWVEKNFAGKMFRRCECEAQLLYSCRTSPSTLLYAATLLMHRSPQPDSSSCKLL